MSLALLHILMMGFVLVLVVVLVLESLPAEWWSNGVSECCAFSEFDPPSGAFSLYPMSLALLQILRPDPKSRRPSALIPRAVRRVLPLRNRIVTVPEPRPTGQPRTSGSSSLPL
jgi:hypothetical protein